MNLIVGTITLPTHWASYLINDDATGLEPGEQEVIDAFLEGELPECSWIVDCDSESEDFRVFEGLLTEVSTYTYHMHAEVSGENHA